MKIKVGSLFDGIGGAPLAAIMSGAEPVWAAEIEKIPASITERHFPNMKHYGDVTQINGAEIEPVDVIVGGSPCQDLSVAGKRAGLEGERSGLFMDQVRIVKEMRNATRRETEDGTDELPRPRYMVWENVPGAFSSNKGEDFRAVLEEVCRIGEEEVSIPRPPKGKWSKSGSILGDGYSVAWRQVDAQHWGVPQRRRRIYLVADFGGQSAPEICFEREGLSGDIAEGGEEGQGVAEDAERSSGSSGESGIKSAGFIGSNGSKAHGVGYEEEKSPTVVAGRTNDVVIESYGLVSKGNGEAFLMEEKHMSLSCGGGQAGQGYPAALVLNDQGGSVMGVSYGVTGTLRAEAHGHQPIVVHDCEPSTTYSLQGNMIGRADHNGPQGSGVNEDVSFTLNTVDRHAVCFEPRSPDGVHRIHGGISPTLNTAQGGQRQPCIVQTYQKTVGTLCAADHKGIGNQYVEADKCVVSQGYIVRRLTPLECERLQGFPDGWTAEDVNGKTVSDTQRYKALGNSFAMPNAYFFISRVIRELREGKHES